MKLPESISAEVAEALDASLNEFFDMMLGVPLVLMEKCDLQSKPAPTDDWTVVLAWTGQLQGFIGVSMPAKAAQALTYALVQHQSDEVDETVVDALGEAGNIIAGGAKAKLCKYEMQLSLPTVMHAQSASLACSSKASTLVRTYDYEGAVITLVGSLSPGGELAAKRAEAEQELVASV